MKKRFISFVLAVVLVLGLIPITETTMVANAVTERTVEGFIAPIEPPDVDSIPISNREELEAIKDNLSGKYYLTRDIDLSGDEWVPIGDKTNPFAGVLDGQGYIIHNMKITGEGYEYNGLFGYALDVTIKNVGMVNANINITTAQQKSFLEDYPVWAGGISGVIATDEKYGSLGSKIINCHVKGKIEVHYPNWAGTVVGGICGSIGIRSSIEFCYNTATITSVNPNGNEVASGADVGGICGFIGYGTINNCYNAGDISISIGSPSQNPPLTSSNAGATAGGITASSGGGTTATPLIITNCYNTGNIYVHGCTWSSSSRSFVNLTVAGISWGANTISNCYNTGEIKSVISAPSNNPDLSAWVMGIGGYMNVNNCYNIGIVSSTFSGNISDNRVSGLSSVSWVTVTNSYCLNLYDSERGIQLTDSQMKNKEEFIGFDFENLWDISPDVNNGYPFLRDINMLSKEANFFLRTIFVTAA